MLFLKKNVFLTIYPAFVFFTCSQTL